MASFRLSFSNVVYVAPSYNIALLTVKLKANEIYIRHF
jgi:hypothetical protein